MGKERQNYKSLSLNKVKYEYYSIIFPIYKIVDLLFIFNINK